MKRTPLKRTPFRKKKVLWNNLDFEKPRKRKTSKGLFPKKESKTDEWNRIKREIKPHFEAYGLYDICELKLYGCMGIGTEFAHSKKRGQIATQEPERTRELKEVVRSCPNCHKIIEYPKPTEEETGRQIMYRIVLECIARRNKRLKIISIYA